MREKKTEKESERVAGRDFLVTNRKAQLTNEYHIPGLIQLRDTGRLGEKESLR